MIRYILFLAKTCSFFGLFIFAKFLDINEVGRISMCKVIVESDITIPFVARLIAVE